MAEAIYASKESDDWDGYWSVRSIEQQLGFCLTDGLLPIFEQYLPKNGLILEAGCGLGKWVIYFRKKGFKAIGLDGNFSCLSKIKEYDSAARIMKGQVELLPIKNESFDAYISLGVIEHFRNGPQQALEEASRVLKPYGLALIEVPYQNSLRSAISPFKRIFRALRKRLNKEPGDYHFAEFRYTKNELRKFLKMAGFEVIFVAPKDDTLASRNIGLWLDFPFVRARDKDDSAHELNIAGRILSYVLRSISPWISCACVVCVCKKRI